MTKGCAYSVAVLRRRLAYNTRFIATQQCTTRASSSEREVFGRTIYSVQLISRAEAPLFE